MQHNYKKLEHETFFIVIALWNLSEIIDRKS